LNIAKSSSYSRNCFRVRLYYVAPDKFLVRVPVADLDDAPVHAEEKGIVLMKWIRKELKGIEAGL